VTVPASADQGSSAVFDLLYDFDQSDLPLNNGSQALEIGRLIVTGRTYLLSFTVLNTNASAQYIQIHDVSAPPSSGAIPAVVFTAAGTANLVISYVMPGRRFHRGIYITNSSSAATLTAGSADCFFDVQFISAGLI